MDNYTDPDLYGDMDNSSVTPGSCGDFRNYTSVPMSVSDQIIVYTALEVGGKYPSIE